MKGKQPLVIGEYLRDAMKADVEHDFQSRKMVQWLCLMGIVGQKVCNGLLMKWQN